MLVIDEYYNYIMAQFGQALIAVSGTDFSVFVANYCMHAYVFFALLNTLPCHANMHSTGVNYQGRSRGFLRFPETGQVFYSDLQWYKCSDRNTLIEQSTTLIEQQHLYFS